MIETTSPIAVRAAALASRVFIALALASAVLLAGAGKSSAGSYVCVGDNCSCDTKEDCDLMKKNKVCGKGAVNCDDKGANCVCKVEIVAQPAQPPKGVIGGTAAFPTKPPTAQPLQPVQPATPSVAPIQGTATRP